MDSQNSTGLWGHYFEGRKSGSFHIEYKYIIVTNSLRLKFVGKNDHLNPQTSITLEQISIRKALTSLEPWIPALCALQTFMKQINDLSIPTEVFDNE